MMNHNLPPSPFGAGSQYDGKKQIIVHPAGYEVRSTPEHSVDMPRIARESGAIAVENTAAEPIPLGPGFIESVVRKMKMKTEAQVNQTSTPAQEEVVESAIQSSANSYAGPASRQMDLERAEQINIQRAAEAAGMTVDQWKAARSSRR